jgi:hypothetical protein
MLCIRATFVSLLIVVIWRLAFIVWTLIVRIVLSASPSVIVIRLILHPVGICFDCVSDVVVHSDLETESHCVFKSFAKVLSL